MATWVTADRARELVEASTYETTTIALGEAPPDAVPYAKAAPSASSAARAGNGDPTGEASQVAPVER